MTFEEWINRPVYVARCVTWRKACELNLSNMGFRAARKYRDGYAQIARDMIALSVKMDRLAARRKLC